MTLNAGVGVHLLEMTYLVHGPTLGRLRRGTSPVNHFVRMKLAEGGKEWPADLFLEADGLYWSLAPAPSYRSA